MYYLLNFLLYIIWFCNPSILSIKKKWVPLKHSKILVPYPCLTWVILCSHVWGRLRNFHHLPLMAIHSTKPTILCIRHLLVTTENWCRHLIPLRPHSMESHSDSPSILEFAECTEIIPWTLQWIKVKFMTTRECEWVI